MATILRPPLVSQGQRKRPIAPVDYFSRPLTLGITQAPAGPDLPLRTGRLFDSAPRNQRWQPDALVSQGFIVDDSVPAVAALSDSAPRRLRRLTSDQSLDLLTTTLAQTGLGLPLLSARLSDSAPRKRRHLSVDGLQRPFAIGLQYLLQVADALHDHAADNVVLAVGVTLSVADAEHAHTVDNIDLVQANALAVADALHGHAVNNTALTQAHVLVVSESSHEHTVESLTLSTGLQLELQDALHAHLAEQPSLTQAHVLVVSDALHAHLADLVSIFDPASLVVNDALHAHLCDALGIARVSDATRRVIVVAVNRTVRVH